MQSLIIHGGLSAVEGLAHRSFKESAQALLSIVRDAYAVQCSQGAQAGVLDALRAMESDPLFNAGRGSRLQADGAVRMSAALMNGNTLRFSGVVNVQNIEHPIDLAQLLATQPNTVLAGDPATQFAHAQGFALWDPITPERQLEYTQQQAGSTGTVGAVGRDDDALMYAGISTGGVGMETPGRMSDSPTVAGCYVDSQAAGVACTGVGEEIVNSAAAAKTVTRVADGLGLAAAVKKTIAEADQHHFCYGLIALDCQGETVVGQTKEIQVFWASADASGTHCFLEPSKNGT